MQVLHLKVQDHGSDRKRRRVEKENLRLTRALQISVSASLISVIRREDRRRRNHENNGQEQAKS